MKACWCGWMVRPAPRRVMVFRAVRAMVSVDGVAGWSGSFPSGFSVGGGVHLSAGVAPAVPVPILQRTCQPGTRNPPTGPSTTSTTPPWLTLEVPRLYAVPSDPDVETVCLMETSTCSSPSEALVAAVLKFPSSGSPANSDGRLKARDKQSKEIAAKRIFLVLSFFRKEPIYSELRIGLTEVKLDEHSFLFKRSQFSI